MSYNEITFLGNYLSDIERIYTKINRSWEWGSEYESDDLKKETEQLLNRFPLKDRHYSSFAQFEDKESYWHRDSNYSMIISSYPKTTEIFKSFDDKYQHSNVPEILIDKELESSEENFIFPEQGDVYYLPPNTFHRANPKRVYPHLVIREWGEYR